MTKPCVPTGNLHELQLTVNEYTVDAIKLSGWNSRSNSEPTFKWFTDYAACIRPFGRKLDSSLVPEVISQTITAALRTTDFDGDRITRELLKQLSWPIACRTQARELRKRSKFIVHPQPELIHDEKAQAPFGEVETNLVLDSAATNLEEIGVRRDWVSAVVLYLIGWKPSDIAEVFGAKVETIRKRIARSRQVVMIELRKQFTLEVN